jgi:hypothetical protein
MPNIKKGNVKIGKKFTKDYQPTSKAKSEGHKKAWEYQKIRRSFLEALTNIEMPDGSKRNFWDYAVLRLHKELIFTDNIKIEKFAEIIFKLLDLVPKEDKNSLYETDYPPKITIQFVGTDGSITPAETFNGGG